jgi:iron(III) transport system ATP-binding protein
VEVKRILKLEGITAIMVTHDQEEAFAFADQIAVMHAGKIHQMDTPFNLYHQPGTEFVANFIGKGVLLSGEISGDGQVTTELGNLGSDTGNPGGTRFTPGQAVKVLVRPDDVKLAGASGIAVTVEDKIFAGTATQYTLKTHSGQTLLASLASHHDFDLHQVIHIELDLPHMILFQTT